MKTTKHRDLIYDIGMHKGEDTDYYLKKGFRVVGFEANPELARDCRNRFMDFIEQGKLVIVEGAIVSPDLIRDGKKKIQFYVNEDLSVWGTVSSSWADRNERLGTASRTIEVDAIDFADVIQEYGMPHYMKIDIEGCDMVCVHTLSNFSERPDYVSIESDKTSFSNIRREIDTLAALGYDSFQAVEQSVIPLVQAPNPPKEGAYVAHIFEYGSSGLFGSELGEEWKSRDEINRLYRFIRLGYCLLGDDGIMTKWTFRGSRRLRRMTSNFLRRFTKAAVPGWYDTHARHSSADVGG